MLGCLHMRMIQISMMTLLWKKQTCLLVTILLVTVVFVVASQYLMAKLAELD